MKQMAAKTHKQANEQKTTQRERLKIQKREGLTGGASTNMEKQEPHEKNQPQTQKEKLLSPKLEVKKDFIDIVNSQMRQQEIEGALPA